MCAEYFSTPIRSSICLTGASLAGQSRKLNLMNTPRDCFGVLYETETSCPKSSMPTTAHPMRGVTLAVFLDSLMISRSHSRPRCSNDNAHIESYHKTMKYTVGYPKMFTSIDHARSWYADFVHWYNTGHLHSALGYVTPHQRRTGEADQIYATRNKTIVDARERNPLRWRRNRTFSYTSKPVSFEYRPLVQAA
jgi:hypothetical protein